MALNDASGWRRDPANNRLAIYYRGALAGHVKANGFGPSATSYDRTGSLSLATTVTAGTGLIVTSGNDVVTAGDHRVTAGNARLGVVSAFATTEPTSAYIMKAGTAPVGAVTTSSGIFSSATVVRKIIADGTASNVET